MRRLAVIPLTAAGLVVLSVPAAPAVGPPRLSVTPSTVHLGDQVTIRGREWPVIEFCKRRVRLRLESEQNAVLIGFARIRDRS